MNGLTFVARRLIALLLLLLLVSMVVYSLIDLSPGPPEQALLPPDAWFHEESVRAIRERYRLDEPTPVRYWYWLTDVAKFDLGRSVVSGNSVVSVLTERVSITAQLAALTLAIVVMVGVPFGMLAAARRDSALDRWVTSVAVVASSVPGFAIGLLFIYVFGVALAWLPPFGIGRDDPLDRITHLILPALALGTPVSAYMYRQTRAAALDLMQRDFVTFARARGLSERRLFVNYALRNASLPIVTALGLIVIGTLSGAVLVETVFAIPGLGTLLVGAIASRDVPVQQAITLFAGAVVVLTNLAVDLLVLVLDPRTRYPEAT